MKFNQWTLALASVGIVSLGSVAQAEEQHSVMTALSTTTLSGYVDTSASWWTGTQNKPSTPGAINTGLPGRSFDGANKQDGFNLNAVKLVLEKPLGDATTWSAGYKADLVFGPDADYYSSRNTITGLSNADDFSVKQAYVALRAPVGNGLDLKLGVWDTIIGYEFFESGSNPNYSRSYGYALEPTHHTGLLASYKLTEMFSVSGGIANSYVGPVNDRPITESKKTYMAAVTVTLPEATGPLKNSVISLGYVGGQYGPAVVGVTNPHDTRSYYAGMTLNTPVEGLSVGAAWDYRENAPAALGLGAALPETNDAWAAALYATYAMDKWSFNVRADYTQGTNGTFYNTGTGDRNELGSLTGTIGYSLWENVLTRFEARYDRAMGGDHPFGISDEQALTLAINAIYKF
jgi:predicted porin